jgi:NADH-quinone oxidoreductase subunit L
MHATSILSTLSALLPLQHEAGAAHAAAAAPMIGQGPASAALIPLLPLLSFVLCALCAAFKVRSKLPAWITVVCIGAAFGMTVSTYMAVDSSGKGGAFITHLFDWINYSWGTGAGQHFIADFSFYLDTLTCLWMLFVTGLATLIALYASEYMSHDVGAGYCRFFAAFSLFVFSMACLVMGDNFLVLYLGWEGVGLCSYLLIGYFYKKPSAVAAAKKAFIVNRIGDLFLALGIMLCWVHFGTVEYKELFAQVQPYIELVKSGEIDKIPAMVQLIPMLLMVGAFGKSAQLPLYVWLPDAMEGPTPVSALIHAATMVTAGVYLIARTYPLFLLSPDARPIVGWVGALTALLAATIGMAQFDIKRIMAYSTVSQLGYMFCGLAVLSSTGAAAHVFTHAFFKAMLFLSCGAVMHGFAGQLDLRKLSGVAYMKGWGIVGLAMFVGCLNLAGFPVITAGYWSKDMILGEAFANPHTHAIGWILLLTAGLTAYYTFRVFFRVFVGPKYYEPGDELHAHDDHGHGDHGHGHDDHGHGHAPAAKHADAAAHFHPHPPGWAINLVLGILAIAAFAAILPLKMGGEHGGWLAHMVDSSSAHYTGAAAYAAGHGGEHAHSLFFGYDAHKAMMVVSGVVGFIGIFVAFILHYAGRTTARTSRADALLPLFGPLAKAAQGKWFVDEIYDVLIVKPLWVISNIFALVDKYVVDGLVDFAGWLPRAIGRTLRPSQSGELHGYAAGMAGGLAVLILIVLLVTF